MGMDTARTGQWPGAGRALAAVAELAWPLRCGLCDRLGASLCDDCVAALAPLLCEQVRQVEFDVALADSPPTWALAPYGGAIAAAIKAHKDKDRYDLAPVLGMLLEHALTGMLQQVLDVVDHRSVAVVPIPSSGASNRRRGRSPMHDIARTALRGTGVEVTAALRSHGRVRDQAALSAAGRGRNVRGSMRQARSVNADVIVLVDDVVTTGATLAEAGRVLRLNGNTDVFALVLAARRRDLAAPPTAGAKAPDK